MAYNQNFYNNFYGGNFTFQNRFPNPLSAPPPPPASLFSPTPQLSDQEFLKTFERHVNNKLKPKPIPRSINICQIKQKLKTIMTNVHELQEKQKDLLENVDNYTEETWNMEMNLVSSKKTAINELLSQLSGSYMEQASKYLSKRMSKRLRLKRLRDDTRRQKEERIKDSKERSRKIDENLQKIKNDILKAKQEEEAKLEADMVLKDVHRKKIDAKKCLAKLDALLRLRQARQNTAKGRGQNVSDKEAHLFHNNIEKLKTLWRKRLDLYDKEEIALSKQLTKHSENLDKDVFKVENNLQCWKEVLFGGQSPQVDFKGDLDKFVAVRSQWDRYIDKEGSSIPIGWIINTK